MTFHTSLFLVAFSASVTRPTLSRFVSPSNIFYSAFLCCVFLQSFQLSKDVLVSLLSRHVRKKVALRLRTLFISGLVLSASLNIASLDFFAVHEIRSILRWNCISFASFSFPPDFKLSKPRTHTSEWFQYMTISLQGSSSYVNRDVVMSYY